MSASAASPGGSSALPAAGRSGIRSAQPRKRFLPSWPPPLAPPGPPFPAHQASRSLPPAPALGNAAPRPRRRPARTFGVTARVPRGGGIGGGAFLRLRGQAVALPAPSPAPLPSLSLSLRRSRLCSVPKGGEHKVGTARPRGRLARRETWLNGSFPSFLAPGVHPLLDKGSTYSCGEGKSCPHVSPLPRHEEPGARCTHSPATCSGCPLARCP